MSSETSPLLSGSNGRAEPVNGSYYDTRSDDDHSQRSSTANNGYNGATNGQRTTTNDARFYLGHDKRSLFETPTSGLSSVEASRRLKTFGANDYEAVELPTGALLLSHLCRPKAALVWVAMVLELAQSHWASAAVLLFFQVVTSSVGWFQQVKMKSSLAALRGVVKAEAIVVRDGVHQTINASLLVPGDRLTLSAGGVVPADCALCEGTYFVVNQALLTGESLPVSLSCRDSAKMGSTIVVGEGDVVVIATGQQTFLAKTHSSNDPLADGSKVAQFEKLAVRITLSLLCVVTAAVAVCLSAFLFNRERALRVVSYAVVFTVVAVPLSLSAVCKLVVAMGSSRLLDDKILLTRLDSVEKLARMDVLCCDKTGTLTRNKLELQDDLPIFDPSATREDVLVSAALAAKWKEPPRDAVDTLVLNAIDLRPLDHYALLQHSPFESTSKRAESIVRDPMRRIFKVAKGSPESLLALAHNADDVRDAVEAKVMDLARRGISSLAVARTEEESGAWVFLGIITYLDPPRHDSKRMIEKSHACGVSVKMVTGDQAAIAVEACRQLGMGMTVLDASIFPRHGVETQANASRIIEAADGYAHMLPDDKSWVVEQLRHHGWSCGVTGACVTDVAAMQAASAAIAVEGATDAARRAADVVLGKPGLSIIVSGVMAARGIVQRVSNYVLFQMVTTFHLVAWLVVATLLFRMDGCHFNHFVVKGAACVIESDDLVNDDHDHRERVGAFFQLPIEALAIIGFIRELTSVALLHDVAMELTQPQRWNSTRLVVVAVVTGLVAATSSLVLSFWALDSWNNQGVLSAYGVGSLSMGQIASVVFLQVTLASIASIVVCRGPSSHLFSTRPAPMLVVVVAVNAILATAMALFSPFVGMEAISFKLVLFVWVYTVLWLFVQSAISVLISVAMDELFRMGVLDGGAAVARHARHESQRLNRIRLGLSFWSDESTVHDSFVVGRAVRSTPRGAAVSTLTKK